MEPDACLVLEGVTKLFGGLLAVDALSFEAGAGRITALIGPNGAGKTTVINLITGVLHSNGGRLSLHGRDLSRLGAAERARAGVSRSYQTPQMVAGLSALENVAIGADLRFGMTMGQLILRPWRVAAVNRAAHEVACAALRRVRIAEPLWGRPAADLSYGDQRRVELARCLAHQPKVLLLDEPAAGLNPRETGELGDFLLGLAEGGLCILLVEHDMPLVMRVSHHVVVVNFGRKIAEGEPSVVQNDPLVIETYLGSTEVEEAVHG